VVDLAGINEFYRWNTIYNNIPKVYWAITFVALGNPATRRLGFRMASYGGRVLLNTTVSTYSSVLKTPFVRGGSSTGLTVLRFGGYIAAGYALGVGVGSAISYGLYGEEGVKDFIDVTTGGVSPSKYISTVHAASKEQPLMYGKFLNPNLVPGLGEIRARIWG
jgi:hypothetical protein